MQNNKEKQYYSVPEVAKIMNISRIAVFKKIKAGTLKTTKVGRNYIISNQDLAIMLGKSLSEIQKEEIKDVVKKAVKKYRVAFKRLGEEK